jgi:hypothetical protein
VGGAGFPRRLIQPKNMTLFLQYIWPVAIPDDI